MNIVNLPPIQRDVTLVETPQGQVAIVVLETTRLKGIGRAPTAAEAFPLAKKCLRLYAVALLLACDAPDEEEPPVGAADES